MQAMSLAGDDDVLRYVVFMYNIFVDMARFLLESHHPRITYSIGQHSDIRQVIESRYPENDEVILLRRSVFNFCFVDLTLNLSRYFFVVLLSDPRAPSAIV